MQICNFFADSKSRAQELSNDVSFVMFGHQTWDLEGGVKSTPPHQHILVFKYPSRDRVKIILKKMMILQGRVHDLTELFESAQEVFLRKRKL